MKYLMLVATDPDHTAATTTAAVTFRQAQGTGTTSSGNGFYKLREW